LLDAIQKESDTGIRQILLATIVRLVGSGFRGYCYFGELGPDRNFALPEIAAQYAANGVILCNERTLSHSKQMKREYEQFQLAEFGGALV
jgi:hypothetical protein